MVKAIGFFTCDVCYVDGMQCSQRITACVALFTFADGQLFDSKGKQLIIWKHFGEKFVHFKVHTRCVLQVVRVLEFFPSMRLMRLAQKAQFDLLQTQNVDNSPTINHNLMQLYSVTTCTCHSLSILYTWLCFRNICIELCCGPCHLT